MSRRLRPPCTVCRLEPVDPVRGTPEKCEGCHRAARDTESPLDLGGRWVLDRATRTRAWVPTPTTRRPRGSAAV